NRGEYIRDKWKKKRRGFIKMHVAVDTRTKKIVSMKVTNEERMFLTADRRQEMEKETRLPNAMDC
ncbi:MAG TPA: hypothetical protein VNI77_06260, partial [Nitrososphaera sp.]|nr:hypothetical protein [Nitrososphaera sp.]